LLKSVDFKLDLESDGLPTKYTKRFAELLYAPIIGQSFQTVLRCADAIANDSFLTYVNVLYSVQTVALACVCLAAARFKHPLPVQLLETTESDPITPPFNFEGVFSQYKRRKQYECDKKQRQ